MGRVVAFSDQVSPGQPAAARLPGLRAKVWCFATDPVPLFAGSGWKGPVERPVVFAFNRRKPLADTTLATL